MFKIGDVVRGRISRDVFVVRDTDGDGWVKVVGDDWSGWLPGRRYAFDFVERPKDSQPPIETSVTYIVTDESSEVFIMCNTLDEAKSIAEKWFHDGRIDLEIHTVIKTITPKLTELNALDC